MVYTEGRGAAVEAAAVFLWAAGIDTPSDARPIYNHYEGPEGGAATRENAAASPTLFFNPFFGLETPKPGDSYLY